MTIRHSFLYFRSNRNVFCDVICLEFYSIQHSSQGSFRGYVFKGIIKDGYKVEFWIDKQTKEIDTAYLVF